MVWNLLATINYHCWQSNHYLATKYHLWWLHLLLTSHKLNREHAYKLATSTFHLVVETEKLIQSNHYFSKTLFFFSRVANSLNKLFNIFNCHAWNFAWNTNCVFSLSFSFLLRHFKNFLNFFSQHSVIKKLCHIL